MAVHGTHGHPIWLKAWYFLFSSGSAETLLKKNAEPILHIAGLDVTIVKVKSDLLLSNDIIIGENNGLTNLLLQIFLLVLRLLRLFYGNFMMTGWCKWHRAYM